MNGGQSNSEIPPWREPHQNKFVAKQPFKTYYQEPLANNMENFNQNMNNNNQNTFLPFSNIPMFQPPNAFNNFPVNNNLMNFIPTNALNFNAGMPNNPINFMTGNTNMPNQFQFLPQQQNMAMFQQQNQQLLLAQQPTFLQPSSQNFEMTPETIQLTNSFQFPPHPQNLQMQNQSIMPPMMHPFNQNNLNNSSNTNVSLYEANFPPFITTTTHHTSLSMGSVIPHSHNVSFIPQMGPTVFPNPTPVMPMVPLVTTIPPQQAVRKALPTWLKDELLKREREKAEKEQKLQKDYINDDGSDEELNEKTTLENIVGFDNKSEHSLGANDNYPTSDDREQSLSPRNDNTSSEKSVNTSPSSPQTSGKVDKVTRIKELLTEILLLSTNELIGDAVNNTMAYIKKQIEMEKKANSEKARTRITSLGIGAYGSDTSSNEEDEEPDIENVENKRETSNIVAFNNHLSDKKIPLVDQAYEQHNFDIGTDSDGTKSNNNNIQSQSELISINHSKALSAHDQQVIKKDSRTVEIMPSSVTNKLIPKSVSTSVTDFVVKLSNVVVVEPSDQNQSSQFKVDMNSQSKHSQYENVIAPSGANTSGINYPDKIVSKLTSSTSKSQNIVKKIDDTKKMTSRDIIKDSDKTVLKASIRSSLMGEVLKTTERIQVKLKQAEKEKLAKKEKAAACKKAADDKNKSSSDRHRIHADKGRKDRSRDRSAHHKRDKKRRSRSRSRDTTSKRDNKSPHSKTTSTTSLRSKEDNEEKNKSSHSSKTKNGIKPHNSSTKHPSDLDDTKHHKKEEGRERKKRHNDESRHHKSGERDRKREKKKRRIASSKNSKRKRSTSRSKSSSSSSSTGIDSNTSSYGT